MILMIRTILKMYSLDYLTDRENNAKVILAGVKRSIEGHIKVKWLTSAQHQLGW